MKALLLFWGILAAAAVADTVDFRWSPPQWQTAICLPDDPHKSLVDKSGALLYHYGQGGREFATRISVEVVSNAVWQKQELLSPRVPIVRTFRSADGLKIVEEAFAVTDLRQPAVQTVPLHRLDSGSVIRNWAKPPAGLDPSLQHIAINSRGGIRYELAVPAGESRRIALALCEGWWSEAGKRVQGLRVEGAEPRTVDTVADIGKNQAAAFWFDAKDADNDGNIAIEVTPKGKDRNAILNGLWIFAADQPPNSEALLAGKLKPLARMSDARPAGAARNDLILVHVTNTGAAPRTVQPKVIVDSKLGVQRDGQRIIVNEHETITGTAFEPLTVPAGQTARFFVLYSAGGAIVLEPRTLEQALASRERAVAYWENAPLPYGRVQVPDAGIQALVDSSIRNIWQAREIKKGLPAFQVGPTCYRGLWIVDGAFLLEAATILGAGDQARNGVAYVLTHQQPDGRIEVMQNYSKENGIVLWTCLRHAQLTQDKTWLESIWPQLVRIAEHIRTLRKQTLTNDTPLDDGLVPPGFPDGGIGGVHAEYTNPYWNLAGLHAFVQAACWLGHADEAARWQREYDDFMAAFRKAAARDMKTDSRGNRYLPIRMDGEDLPQRGQWAFCHAVYPGQIFAENDPLVAGNLAMLEATEREDMVYGTGWDASGIWNYFASFYAHAWLWQGNGRKAAQALYAFANHAAPVLVWREEQSLKGEPYKKVGDMPHNWASAEFIRLVVHLLALDRGNELHLLAGLPTEWTRPGMVTRLTNIATPFGKLTMKLQVADDGRSAVLHVEPLSDSSCRKIVVHAPDGKRLERAPGKTHTLRLPLP